LPDIEKLLWPRSVAIIGASSDTRGLRGRIVQILKSHPYEGAIYPVSRSETEVQGLKAYRTVADLPAPADLEANPGLPCRKRCGESRSAMTWR
jgi:acyl-CoA synthetase (NDP forming)